MNVWRLVCREIAYRKIDFLLGVAAVLAAVACLVGVMTLLRAHGGRVAELNAQKQQETASMMDLAQDDYRKMMKTMGYNVVILNKEEDLSEFWTNGYAKQLMPYELVTRLCESDIKTLQHLMPQLYQRIEWPEQDNCPIILIGVRGEVIHKMSNRKEPMIDPVEKGSMRVGSALGEKLGLKPGDNVTLLGERFKIADVHKPRGNADDSSVWIHMDEAQKLLEKPGKVNAILALSCLCAQGDLELITRQIETILPETQVIHRIPEALIRLDARYRVATLSQETIEKETEYHARLGAEREAFASWLVPLAMIAATVWIGLLAWGNVRERRAEIGILRALGLRSRQILGVFLGKAFLMGLTGAVIGYAGGFAAGAAWSAAEGVPLTARSALSLFDARLLVSVLVLAPLLACVASWLPALVAAQQDPAAILREE